MKRNKAIKLISRWMSNSGISDLRDMDCSEAAPRDCSTDELVNLVRELELA